MHGGNPCHFPSTGLAGGDAALAQHTNLAGAGKNTAPFGVRSPLPGGDQCSNR